MIPSDHSGSEISDQDEQHDEHNQIQEHISSSKNKNVYNNSSTPESHNRNIRTPSSQFDQEVASYDHDCHSRSLRKKSKTRYRNNDNYPSTPSNDYFPSNYPKGNSNYHHPMVLIPSPRSLSTQTTNPPSSIRQQLLEITKLKDYVEDKHASKDSVSDEQSNSHSLLLGKDRRHIYRNPNREFEEQETVNIEKTKIDKLLAACQQISSHERTKRKSINKYKKIKKEHESLPPRLDDSRSDEDGEVEGDECVDNFNKIN